MAADGPGVPGMSESLPLSGPVIRRESGSGARVHRFGPTERRLHWVHAGAFMTMLGTGLVLYLPFLAQAFSARPAMKALHLAAAVVWLTALALMPLLGDRRALRRTRRDLERFDADDLRWLRSRGGGRAAVPQGRFNAGQKIHAVLQAALSMLFVVSGTLLWLGERNTDLRLPGTLALHDMAMFVAGTFVAGHVYMASLPQHREALEASISGTVPAEYAMRHHPKWQPEPVGLAAPHSSRGPGAARLALAVVVVLLGLIATVALVRDVFHGDDARPAVVQPVAPPA